MRKALSLILAIIMLVSVFPISAMALDDGGTAEDDVNWGDITSGDEFVISQSKALTKYNGTKSVVVVPNGVTSIATSSFSGCKTLEVLVLPEGVTQIDSYAFTSCSNLKIVCLSKSVATVSSNAFNGCTGLESVFYAGNETDKSNMTIGTSGNSTFRNAEWHYDSCAYGTHVFDYDCDANCNNCDWIRDVTNATHAYDDDCTDTTCANCGTVREAAEHVFDNCEDTTCANCAVTREAQEHVYDDDCTDTTCANCAATREAKEHVYADCEDTSCANCSVTRENAGHVYDNACDTTCNMCGHEREVVGSVFEYNGFLFSVNQDLTLTFKSWYAGEGIADAVDTIEIPSTVDGITVTVIGEGSFDMANVKNVVIPNTIVKIEDAAFLYCESLEYVNIPASVEFIGTGAFSACSSNKGFNVDPDNENYASVNGVLFNKEMTTLIHYPLGLTDTEFVVPEGITLIGHSAFRYCTALKKVTLSNSVKTISDFAFDMCENLEEINFGKGLETIGSAAFEYCTSLTVLELPDSLKELKMAAFYGCSSVETVILTKDVIIGDYVFSEFEALTDVCYKGSEEDRANLAIGSENEALINATWQYNYVHVCEHEYDNDCDANCNLCDEVRDAGHAYSSDYDAKCNNCGEIRTVTDDCYIYTITDGKATITDVEDTIGGDIIIPSTLGGCPVTTIGNMSFNYSSEITSIIIPDSVKTIDDWAFAYCSGITSIIIPNSVETIGFKAFNNCSSLASVTIPDSVTSIGKYVFSGTAYFNDPDNWEDEALYIDNHLIFVKESIIGAYTVKEGTKTIAYAAFEFCERLTSVTIPECVTNIDERAFQYCTGLTSVTIPVGVTSILYETFVGCSSLTDVYYGGSVDDRNNMFIDSENECLTNAKWHYAIVIECEHTYDNNCDDTCNKCYEVRDVEGHTFEKQNKDDSHHWLECECGEIDALSVENHSYSRGHDEDYHWLYCACGHIHNKEGHKYDNDCDDFCNDCYREREVGDHTWLPATCTDPKTCKNCGETEGDELGHKQDNGTVTKKATCTATGKKTYKCTVCGTTTKTQTLAKLSHTSDKGTVTKKATCTATGTKTYKCTVCGTTTKTETLAKVAHTSDKGTVTKKATCTATGTKTYKCTVCGTTTKTETIKATGHSYADATCTAPKTCKTCKATSGKALGHKYSNDCDTTCNTCGAKRTIKHTYKLTTTKKATLTANGKQEYKCTECGYITKSNAKTIYSVTSFKLSKTSYTYNGKVQTPTVTVKDSKGNTLKKGTDYDVTYASGRKNVGTYKVTIKMKGKYSGTKTLTFKINPIKSTTCSFKLSATSYTYNGKVQTPSVVVKNANGTTLKKGTDYDVTYASGRKNVGTYKVTIKMKGKYTGTKTLTFKINPTKTTLSKVTPATKKLTVTYTKKTAEVSGYEVQYSTSKSFTTKTTKTKIVSKNTTTSASITGLKAKTTYYVRVRTYKTVNGVKYYSGWSTVKSAKTK